MDVSIIVPVFNIDIMLLNSTIDSIIKQTYVNIEILIIDDGSDKAIGKQLDEFSSLDLRIKVYHKNNEGVSVARNYGVDIASGKYVMFVDGDDIIAPWAVEDGLALIHQTGSDIVIGKVLSTIKRENIFRDEERNGSYSIFFGEKDILKLKKHVLNKRERELKKDAKGYGYNFEGCWSRLIKREIALKYRFMSGIVIGEDTIWALQTFNKDVKVCLIDELWYCYVQNIKGVMNCYHSNIVEQLSAPIFIINDILKDETELAEAYNEWIWIKIRQIIRRYYLTENCCMTMGDKIKSFRHLMNIEPWISAFESIKIKSLKSKIKRYICKTGFIILYYSKRLH